MEVEGVYKMTPLETLGEHDDVASSVSSNLAEPDVLASGSWDNTVKLWNMVSSTSTVTLVGKLIKVVTP